MVKGQHGRPRSSSSDSEEFYQRKKHKKHHRVERSSPEESHHRSKSHHHKRRSHSPQPMKHKIKREPESDSDREERLTKHRIKQESGIDRSREDRGHRSRGHRQRDDESYHLSRVKQEPADDMRQQNGERQRNDDRRRDNRNKREHLTESQRYGKREEESQSAEPTEPKDAPNFELSGKLTEDTNTYKGVVIKYNEPPEARKPKKRWRLYPFKNDEALKPFHMHRQSAYLFGRDRIIVDIPVDHPSCSKQHAVWQYRMVPYKTADGRKANKVAPYIIDLDSANGTFVNNKKIEPQRYVELLEKDVIKFGFSSREYVLLHEKSNTAEIEDSDSS